MVVDGYPFQGLGKRHTFDFFIDGKPLEIPIDANFMFISGYNLKIDRRVPPSPLWKSRSYMNYIGTVDGVQIKAIDWEAFRVSKPRHHKLEMVSQHGSRLYDDYQYK